MDREDVADGGATVAIEIDAELAMSTDTEITQVESEALETESL